MRESHPKEYRRYHFHVAKWSLSSLPLIFNAWNMFLTGIISLDLFSLFFHMIRLIFVGSSVSWPNLAFLLIQYLEEFSVFQWRIEWLSPMQRERQASEKTDCFVRTSGGSFLSYLPQASRMGTLLELQCFFPLSELSVTSKEAVHMGEEKLKWTWLVIELTPMTDLLGITGVSCLIFTKWLMWLLDSTLEGSLISRANFKWSVFLSFPSISAPLQI